MGTQQPFVRNDALRILTRPDRLNSISLEKNMITPPHVRPLSIFIAITATCLTAFVQAQSGREIMKQQKERHQVDREETNVRMQIVNRSGKVKERKLSIYSFSMPDGLSKGLIKFTGPADIRNVGLLTWEQPKDKDDDQWLYIPAARRVKRIASGGKKNAFMGTDLAFEDLRPENLEAHNYKLLKDENVDGHDCYSIEAIPSTGKEKKESGYGKRVFWIRKDILVTIKTEFYDKKERLIKVGTSKGIVPLSGDIYRINHSETETVRRKTKTVMFTESRDLEPDFDESFFSQQNLSRR